MRFGDMRYDVCPKIGCLSFRTGTNFLGYYVDVLPLFCTSWVWCSLELSQHHSSIAPLMAYDEKFFRPCLPVRRLLGLVACYYFSGPSELACFITFVITLFFLADFLGLVVCCLAGLPS